MTLLFFQSRDSSVLLLSLYRSLFYILFIIYLTSFFLSLALSASCSPFPSRLCVVCCICITRSYLCREKFYDNVNSNVNRVSCMSRGKIERTSTASESVSLLIGGRDDDWCASFLIARHKCSKSLVCCASHWKTTSLIVEDSKVTDCQDDVNLWCGTDIPECAHVSWSWSQRLNDDEMKMESSADRVPHYWIELLQTTRVRTP